MEVVCAEDVELEDGAKEDEALEEVDVETTIVCYAVSGLL